MVNHDRMYTFFTALVVSAVLLYLHFFAESEWIGHATFVYIILLPGFLLVNGLLTGSGLESPIVNYNERHFLGLRIITIPVEDAFYGYSLFMMNVYFFNRWRKGPVYESARSNRNAQRNFENRGFSQTNRPYPSSKNVALKRSN